MAESVFTKMKMNVPNHHFYHRLFLSPLGSFSNAWLVTGVNGKNRTRQGEELLEYEYANVFVNLSDGFKTVQLDLAMDTAEARKETAETLDNLIIHLEELRDYIHILSPLAEAQEHERWERREALPTALEDEEEEMSVID